MTNRIIISSGNLVTLPINSTSEYRCIIVGTDGCVLIANRATCDIVSLCTIPQTEELLLQKFIDMGYTSANMPEIVECVDQLLKSNVLIIDNGEISRGISSRKSALEHVPATPTTLYLHPTHKCNLNCKYCYNNTVKEINDIDAAEMTIAEWESIVEQIVDAGVKSIIVTGGEPMLRQELLSIWGKAKKAGIHVTFGTNGTLITESNIKTLADAVSMVSLSIDSYTSSLHDEVRGYGTHEKVVNATKLLGKHGVPWQGQTVIHSENYDTVSKTAKYVKSLGAIRHTASFLIECNADTEPTQVGGLEEGLVSSKINPDEDKSMGIHRKCGAGRSLASIDPYGRMYPCHLLHTPQYQTMSLKSARFLEEWRESAGLQRYREFEYDSIESCNNCLFFELCLGGCRGIAMLKSKRVNGFVGDMYCRRKKQGIVQLALQKAQNWLDTGGKDSENIIVLAEDSEYCNE